jgi:hypothetical protein
MKQEMKGEIQFRNVERNPKLREFVETQIKRWVSEHEAIWERIFFMVTFHRKRDYKLSDRRVICHIELVGNSHVWVGSQEGRRARQAFSRCLTELALAEGRL